MASRRRSPPPPPSTRDLVVEELKIAVIVAGAITLVLLARRWTQCALGTGTLNQELFAGNLAVGTLIGTVEKRVKEGGHRGSSSARSARARVSGGAEDDPHDS